MTQSQAFHNSLADRAADQSNDGSRVNATDSHTSNLFIDAYDKFKTQAQEHPRETAAIAGGVVAAVVLARGQAMRTAAKDVLLIEDTPFMGKAYKSALEANGEKVQWFTGVNRVSPLTGTTLEGKSVVIDPRKFKVALVDGDLRGSYLQGEHVVHALSQGGLRSIGTSTIPALNDMMLKNGAKIAAPKGTVLAALIDDNLNLGRAVSTPGYVQRGLNLLTQQMKGAAGKELRKKGDALLMSFAAE
jgi:hypothetical protein